MGKGVEDWYQPVDSVEGECRDGCDVACRKERRLQEVEEEERRAEIRYCQCAVSLPWDEVGVCRCRAVYDCPILRSGSGRWPEVEAVNCVLQSDPGQECRTESEVKETFIRNGQEDERGRKCEEDDHQAVKVVVVGRESMCKR